MTSRKEKIAAEQKYKCANKPGSDFEKIYNYKCMLWKHNDGKFDDAGYEIDHIMEKSITKDDSRENKHALCTSCHSVKTKHFMIKDPIKPKKKVVSSNESSSSSDSDDDIKKKKVIKKLVINSDDSSSDSDDDIKKKINIKDKNIKRYNNIHELLQTYLLIDHIIDSKSSLNIYDTHKKFCTWLKKNSNVEYGLKKKIDQLEFINILIHHKYVVKNGNFFGFKFKENKDLNSDEDYKKNTSIYSKFITECITTTERHILIIELYDYFKKWYLKKLYKEIIPNQRIFTKNIKLYLKVHHTVRIKKEYKGRIKGQGIKNVGLKNNIN